jgi:hypothetical protein
MYALNREERFVISVAVECGADLPCAEAGHPTQHAKFSKQDPHPMGWKDWCLDACGKCLPCNLPNHIKNHYNQAKVLVRKARGGAADAVGTHAHNELLRAEWVLEHAKTRYYKDYVDPILDPMTPSYAGEVWCFAHGMKEVMDNTIAHIYDDLDPEGVLSYLRDYAKREHKITFLQNIAHSLLNENPHHPALADIFDASTYDEDNAEKLELARRAKIKLGPRPRYY